MPGWWPEAFWPMQSIMRVTNTIFLLFAAAVFSALLDISDARMGPGKYHIVGALECGVGFYRQDATRKSGPAAVRLNDRAEIKGPGNSDQSAVEGLPGVSQN
jgi:hypothetical protein